MSRGFALDYNTIKHAESVIYRTYGDKVSVKDKGKDLLKFGRSTQIQDTDSTIMTLPSGIYNETYVYTNAITTISSASENDDQPNVIEGHTISNNELTFVSQTVTLQGQTQVSLGTPLARATRAYNASTANDDDLTGPVYIYSNSADANSDGAPDTLSAVHLMIAAGKNQSEKASTSVSKEDYWIITGITSAVLQKSARFASVELQIRTLPGVWREVDQIASESGILTSHNFNPYVIVPKNSDVRLVAKASVAGTEVTGSIHGFLAKIV